jgi:8-oxo-dGTP pyrophosphatase MutT (NUDIX family)
MMTAEDLAQRVKAVLASRARRVIPRGDLTSAAVLLPLFRERKAYHVLLTKRTHKVKTHKGEISFPGGVRDRSDRDLKETALRESFEEIGLRPGDVKILGCLDDVETMTRYRIRPFVGVFPHPYPFLINREEIEEIVEVPCQSLVREAFLEEKKVVLNSGERVIYAYTYQDYRIWGATAAILKQFVDLVLQAS